MYCLAHTEALQVLSKLKKKTAFRESVDQIELDESLRGLHLLDFVVKPVQRICKYPLLIRVRIITTTILNNSMKTRVTDVLITGATKSNPEGSS
jgi:hypothetical protein